MDEQVTQRRLVRRLGVVGAGLMGSGIAQVAAIGGLDVVLHDAAPGAVEAGRAAVLERLDRAVAEGRLDPEHATGAGERITVADRLEDLAGADAVIEAVIEDPEIKNGLFHDLERIVGEDALLATNTSAIPITRIAQGLQRPERLVGMHFFSPVPATRLCELVRGLLTDDATVERARALAETLGKETILVARDDAGFVTSRLMTVIGQEAVRLVEQGLATPEDVDKACELAFGHRMGPLATLDLTGLDVALRAGEGIHRETADPGFAPPQLLRRMVSAGLLGRKSGRGFFDYAGAGAR
jgi:3-hydroxybutyryl-CoA dehydrogenase